MAPSASTQGFIALVFLTVILQAYEVMSQSGCTSVLISLAPCLNYVTGTASTPSTSCCSQLSTVVQSQPRCLCMLLNGGSTSLGVTMNETLAMALPGACKVETPPVSRCNASTAMVSSPAASPTGDAKAESSSTQMSSNFIVLALLVAMGSFA